MDAGLVTLVIFTCEGREHLLQQTFKSFSDFCDFRFRQIILAVDGPISSAAVDFVKPDIIVRSYHRKGYVNNIVTAIKQIDTPYFFWLEDDFIFHKEIPVSYMCETMAQNNDWAGIFLSRRAPLPDTDKKEYIFDKFFVPDFGYSASPTFCNTQHINSAIQALVKYPKDEKSKLYGFETFFDNYFKQNHHKYALIDPGDSLQVTHVGKLESSAREFHMINSLDNETSLIGKKYISGFGVDRETKFINKAGMLFKLWPAVLSLSRRLWFSREAYDFAFRIYLASRKKFRH